jgi:hypothetical protein
METTNKKPRCQFISKIGARCQADPQTGKDYCFFHDPDQKKKQAEARKQGGEARSRQTEPEITLPPNLSVLPLKNAYDIRMLMAETIDHLRSRTMDLRATRTIGYLAGLHLRALKLDYSPVAMLMAETINQFRCREIDLPTAKTFGMLASVTLCAIKQEDDEREAAAMKATVSGEPTRPAQATSAEAPHPEKIETVLTRIVAAQTQDDHDGHKVYPALVNMADVRTASQPLSS